MSAQTNQARPSLAPEAIKLGVIAKAIAILTPREQRIGLIVLTVFVVASLSSAISVASVYPFLLVLGRPDIVQTNGWMSRFYEFIGSPPLADFAFLLGLLTLLLLLTTGALQILRVYMMERFTLMRVHTISLRLLDVYMSQPITFFFGRNTAEMGTRILEESRRAVISFFRPAAELISGILGVLSIFTALIILTPTFTLAGIVIVIISYLTIYSFNHRILGRLGVSRLAANNARYKVSREALSGIKDIKIAGTEDYFLDRYGHFSMDSAQTEVRANLMSNVPRFFVETMVLSTVLLFALFNLNDAAVNQGSMLAAVIPELGLVALGAQRMFPEIQKIYGSLSMMRFGGASIESVHADLSLPAHRELRRQRKTEPLRLKRTISLRDVSFQYPQAEGPAINGVNLTIRKGEKIGIVGATGGGKSTLVDLIIGLLHPSKGEILVDDRVLGDDVGIRDWQASLAYVPQQIFLSDASIAENIAFGHSAADIDMIRVERAARIAQLHDFVIGSLPDGYATTIGESGVRLSGGQRQRIGIARALYRNADLIVFDEATSALDSVTESTLVSCIEQVSHEQTLIIIAHRLATVRTCDRIFVMKKGKVIASGNWETNMGGCSEFREFVARYEQ